MRIAGETAVVTGASSGVGAAVAEELARRGAEVVLLARRAERLGRVVETIRACGGRACFHAVDLTDPASVERVGEAVRASGQTPGILVNNAGAGRWLFVEETDPDEAVAAMAVPYFAAFFATREFLPGMLARGRGHIVNVTSVGAYVPWPGATAYTAARWAMRGLHQALTADLRGTGVGTTLFACGKIDTDYFTTNPGTEERIPGIARIYRTLNPVEVAVTIAEAVERNRREVVIPWLMRLTLWEHRFFPRAVEWLVACTGWRRGRVRAGE